jgi:small GTP-binding protein
MFKKLLKIIKQAAKDGVTTLDLSNMGLTELPPEIGQLSKLKRLILGDWRGGNQLTALPPEIGQLTQLTSLDIRANQLTALPPEFGQLTQLTSLDLWNNQLTALPPEFGQLTQLTSLYIRRNKLTALPPEFGQLTQLTSLSLYKNKLTALPPEFGQLTQLTSLSLRENQLTALPPEFGQLTQLTSLFLSGNQLTALPPEFGQLTQLTSLKLSRNQLTALPPEFGQLTQLTSLSLRENQLTALPPEIGLLTQLTSLKLWGNKLTALPPAIGQLTQLTSLSLYKNKLTALPPEIGQLTQLTSLDIRANQLTALPPEIGQLTQLTSLDIRWNQLTALPPEIGQLTKLTTLRLDKNKLTALPPEIGLLVNLEEPDEYSGLKLDNNPLKSPPPEIVKQGTKAILAYLQETAKHQQKQWLSKLLLVGQGRVGKTSLLRVLRGEKFNPQEPTTHGLETKKLEIAHPSETNVTMQLNIWDFGGQHIYHATHQFFLTNRSLFLLAWHARMGFDVSKLYYWLDMLTALAPESPVLLVATHIDERDANIPLTELRRHYPQIIGQCEISSKTRQGFKTLQQTIAQAAAQLPLMGEIWPSTWLNAANALRASTENYITPQALQKFLTKQGINSEQQPILTQWLHDLGDILYFQDKNELEEIVILKPQWVTEYISQVLESQEVINSHGILTAQEIERLWHDLTPTMREHILRLMERFDLSYRDKKRQISLIVERLPQTPPPNYQTQWNQIQTQDNCKTITMTFKFNTLPAGIPRWFIARSHRFTTNIHWRSGALFAHENHLALIQASERDNIVQLSVRGPNPHNFLALLKDGLEITLARFPGLKIERKISCLGHNGQACPHEFNYDKLLKRYEKNKLTIECLESLEKVSVPQLLYGLDRRTQDLLLSRLDELAKNQNSSELKALQELTQRQFTNTFHRQQANIDTHCPNVFALKTPEGQKLQLYCQAPGNWHPTTEGGLYEIKEPAQWLKTIAPYLKRLIAVLKYATPQMGKKIFRRDIETTQTLANKMPNKQGDLEQDAALRALRHLLEEQDPQQHWGGLKKVLTPEGHYLWLCEHHAQEYK